MIKVSRRTMKEMFEEILKGRQGGRRKMRKKSRRT
jgi:hypothetical protein